MSLTHLGASQFNTASTFAGSISIPSWDMMNPKNVVFSTENSHFSAFAYSPASFNLARTFLTCSRCSDLFLEYIRMSSI